MRQERIVTLLNSFIQNEGVMPNVIDKLDLFRASNATPRSPLKYEPSIIILAQGQKRVYIGEESITYDPFNYLVLSVPLPLECETMASPEKPLLGLRIHIDAPTVGEILLATDETSHNLKFIPRGIYSDTLETNLLDATIRLLEALASPTDSRFLGPMIIKEIIYRVLCGKKGDALRALAFRNQHFFQIARILDKIHETYNTKLDLQSLAREAGMSISAFHSSFKAVTNSSPLQYIKNIRLHKAKLLMIEEGKNANSAAYQVGYESPSQFNREYKRIFGKPPAKDVSAM